MSEHPAPTSASRLPTNPLARFILFGAIAIVIAFLAGFLPMWFKSRDAARQREAVRTELRATQLQLTLATAAIDVRRGEYERARQASSQFFTSLQQELAMADSSAFNAAQRPSLEALFNQRDQVITLLARSDPASADRLADMHVQFRKAVSQ